MNLQLFEKQQYLNIETFRKDGRGVKTPVWFGQDRNTLIIWTQANSGKAKRIRNNGRAKIAPSDAAGNALGAWQDVEAREDASPRALERAVSIFQKKYGWMFKAFLLMGKLRKARYTTIQITLQ